MGVRWYVAYPLSTRHVEERMEERGMAVDHSTINPTATFIFDLSAATRYALPVYPVYPQEAPYVTRLSERRRRLCHSHV